MRGACTASNSSTQVTHVLVSPMAAGTPYMRALRASVAPCMQPSLGVHARPAWLETCMQPSLVCMLG